VRPSQLEWASSIAVVIYSSVKARVRRYESS
jgi:hypothetical protein